MKEEQINSFMVDSFKDAERERELRLSEEEMKYIRGKFPKVSVKPIKNVGWSNSDKKWYTVSLGQPAVSYSKNKRRKQSYL